MSPRSSLPLHSLLSFTLEALAISNQCTMYNVVYRCAAVHFGHFEFFSNLIYFASVESRHLLYLQLRKSILESQIMCNDDDLIHLGGLALQAEMGKSQYFFLSSSTTLFLLTKQSIFSPFDLFGEF